VIYYFLKH
jgi:hypothetical protein